MRAVLGETTAVTTGGGLASHDGDAAGRGRADLIWIGLAVAVLVGAALRIVFVSDQSIGYEEAYTLSVVRHSSAAGVWRAVKATESTPPLYYLLTWLWTKALGSHSAVVLRLASLLAGSLTVPVAFLAMREFIDHRLALVVAWLCAISPELVIYSIYGRSYALLVLLATVSLWSLGLLLRSQSLGRWAFWVLAATACLWTHYFAIFFVAAEAGALLVLLPQQRRSLLLALGTIAVATAPLWPVVLAQNGAADRTAYIAATPLSTRLEYTVREFTMGMNVPKAALEGAGIALAVAGALFGVVRTYRQRSTQLLLGIAVIGGLVPIMAALVGIRDVYLDRNILGIWICLAALAAYGLVRLKAVPLVVYSAICLLTAIWVQSDWRYQGSPDWKGAVGHLPAQARRDPIAVMPGIQIVVAAIYLHRGELSTDEISTPFRSRDLWVMAQPARGSHQRALNPVPSLPLVQLWGTAFRSVGEIDYRGFRLIHLQANSPTSVLPVHDVPVDNPPAEVLGPA
jgi:hypothetical protein